MPFSLSKKSPLNLALLLESTKANFKIILWSESKKLGQSSYKELNSILSKDTTRKSTIRSLSKHYQGN